MVASDDAAYVHYRLNETIDGITIHEEPDFGDKIVILDYSAIPVQTAGCQPFPG